MSTVTIIVILAIILVALVAFALLLAENWVQEQSCSSNKPINQEGDSKDCGLHKP